MTEYLFSYGTLQKENVQLKLFGRLLYGSRDVLEGYKLSSIVIDDESFLAEGEQKEQLTLAWSGNKTDYIEGTVLEITEEELHLADKYEPVNYQRTEVGLRSGRKAWVYIAV